jgi:hypothetical protein
MSWSSQWSLSFWLSHQYPMSIPLLPNSRYMPYPSQPSWYDHSNYTRRRVKTRNWLATLNRGACLHSITTSQADFPPGAVWDKSTLMALRQN